MRYVIVLFLTNLCLYSQNYRGYVVTDSNDTLKCKFVVHVNLFNHEIYYPYSKNIKIINDKGEKIKFKPNQLKSYYLSGSQIRNYKFVSLEYDNYKYFYDEIHKGKISFYYHYKLNSGGGDPIQTIYVLKDGVFKKINGFSMRKKFGEFIKDYPELYTKWMNSNKSFDLENMDYVVELYNKHFEELK